MVSSIIETETKRLLLRQWRETDLDYFAEINSSKKVMEFYPSILSRQQSDDFAQNIQQRISDSGWGFWAIEIPQVCEFIGFVGLNKPGYELPFELEAEIGWRLSENYWGNGYATEAAVAALDIGFKQLGMSEIVSFASVLNHASINVMQRLKMTKSELDFEHPKVPVGDPLRQHCLYRISNNIVRKCYACNDTVI